MSNEKPYQVRIFLKEEFADAVNRDAPPPEVKPLMDILAKHDASIDHNQFDEFSKFVKWAEANVDTHAFPSEDKKDEAKKLLALTKNSLANEEKASYFKREFTLSIKGKSQFSGAEADALIEDLKTLGDGAILTSGKGFVPGKSYDVEPVRKSYVPKRHPGT
jgi:hypothetical protein